MDGSSILNIPENTTESSDTVSTPRVETSKIVKKIKKKYPILFALCVVVSFCIGAGITSGITHLFKLFVCK